MSILRISARTINGLLIDKDPNVAAEVAQTAAGLASLISRLLSVPGINIETMQPGRTEITPASFSPTHSSRHILDVDATGETGVYWMVPRTTSQHVVMRFLTAAMSTQT